jgi:hypothetical protein
VGTDWGELIGGGLHIIDEATDLYFPHAKHDIADALSGGRLSKAEREQGRTMDLAEKYNRVIKKINKWVYKFDLLSASLKYVRNMANTELQRLHELDEQMTVKQRNDMNGYLQKNKSKKPDWYLEIIKMNDDLGGIQLSSISNPDIVGVIFGLSSSTMHEMPNLVGLTASIVGSLITTVETISNLDKDIAIAKYEQYETAKKIDKAYDSLYAVKANTHRIDEIGLVLSKGVLVYTECFKQAFSSLYPYGEMSKTKRRNRKEAGGSYYTDDEIARLHQVYLQAYFLTRIMDAKL